MARPSKIDRIKAKYVADNPEETPPTCLYSPDDPSIYEVFEGLEVLEKIEAGWWND